MTEPKEVTDQISFRLSADLKVDFTGAIKGRRGMKAVDLLTEFIARWLEWQKDFPERESIPFPPFASPQDARAADLDAEAQRVRDFLAVADESSIPTLKLVAKQIREWVNLDVPKA